MIFSRLWITRSAALSTIFFFMTDLIINYGVTPCAGYRLRTKEGTSTGVGSTSFESNILNNYFKSAINSTRALEEAIYTDILNNLRHLIKTESNSDVESMKKEYKTLRECENGCSRGNRTAEKKTNSRGPATSPKIDVFLRGVGNIANSKGNPTEFRNVTVGDSAAYEKKYLLGYSGNPFGSRQPISGVVEVPEINPLGKGVVDPRKKRSVLHLYNMVLCTTGCNPFAYIGYGCYCGFLGSGIVVDGIDSCCKMHDWCYNSAGCPMFLEYFIPYLWQCHHHQPLCAIDHGYYGGPGSCAQRLCECDRQLALCLRRYPCPSTKAFCTSSTWRLLQNILML